MTANELMDKLTYTSYRANRGPAKAMGLTREAMLVAYPNLDELEARYQAEHTESFDCPAAPEVEL